MDYFLALKWRLNISNMDILQLFYNYLMDHFVDDPSLRRCFHSRRAEVEVPVEALVPVLVEAEAVAAWRLRGKPWRCGDT